VWWEIGTLFLNVQQRPSCTPEILADKKTSAKNPRYLRSATTRPKDYRNSRQVRDASKFLL
jgi:hypothetical protein